jgi:MFS transporter, CP family, cyanate transporter
VHSAYRWRLLAVTAGLYVGFGLVAASLAPIVGPISDDLGLSRSQMGTVLGAWQFVYLGAAIPAGKFIDRVGLRTGLSTGIALIAMSGLLRAGAGGWLPMLAAVGIFGLGGPLVSVGAPTLVSSWFPPNERGLATGIAVSGPVIGSMITLLTANSLLMPAFDDQWRFVVLVFTGIAILLGCAFWVVTASPPGDVPNPWERVRKGNASTRELLRVPIVRTILLLAVLTFFVNHAMGNWLPEILRDHGLSPASAGFWAAIVSIPGLIAGIGLPRLAQPHRRRPMLMTSYMLLSLALVPLALGWGPLTALGVLVYGAMRSAVLPVAMLFLMDDDRVGPANMAAASALYFTAGEIGGVSGPVVVGILADQQGFGAAVGVLAAVALLLVAVSGLIRPVAKSGLPA